MIHDCRFPNRDDKITKKPITNAAVSTDAPNPFYVSYYMLPLFGGPLFTEGSSLLAEAAVWGGGSLLFAEEVSPLLGKAAFPGGGVS